MDGSTPSAQTPTSVSAVGIRVKNSGLMARAFCTFTAARDCFDVVGRISGSAKTDHGLVTPWLSS